MKHLFLPHHWLTAYRARKSEGDACPRCNACKKRVYPFSKLAVDVFGRKLHAKCYERANMAPELVLLLRAAIERLKGGAEFTMEEVFNSSPIVISKIDGGVAVVSTFLAEAMTTPKV